MCYIIIGGLDFGDINAGYDMLTCRTSGFRRFT